MRLCDAAAGALRTAHLLADGTGTWHPAPEGPFAPPPEGCHQLLTLKPGVTVRREFSNAALYGPGQQVQDFTFTADGWPGARLVLSGTTASADAVGRLEAETPRAAVMLWQALLPPLREAGWRDLTLADPAGGPALVSAARDGQVPLLLKHLHERLHGELAAHLLRGAWRDGTLDLAAALSAPITAGALDAVLRAVPGGPPRDLRLPPGAPSPLPTDVQLLANLVRLEGAFEQLPPPALLPRLESLWCAVNLPGGSWDYPWDALPSLRQLTLHDLELDALPPALYRSPTLRELSLSGHTLQLEQTAPGAPLRLERLQLEDAAAARLPSTASLQHLSLTRCELPGGALPALPALRTLSLSRCRWTSLPEGLGHAAALESLSLDGCPLTSLDGLPPLPALRHLSLRGTRLSAFPAALERLPALAYLEAWQAGPGLDPGELRARLPRLEHLHVG